MRLKRTSEVFRITGARQGLAADVRGRQRRYVISMLVRTVAVILAASLWNVEQHIAIVALVLGAVLPYVAVVIANAGRENASSLPSALILSERRELPPGGADGTQAAAPPAGAVRNGDSEVSGGDDRAGARS